MRETEKTRSRRRIDYTASHILESLHTVYLESTPFTTHSEILDALTDKHLSFHPEKIPALLAAILRLRGAGSEEDLKNEFLSLVKIIQAKNEKYGGSALYPVRYLSPATTVVGILVRIDDKISRILEDPTAFGEDAWLDLAGYLFLLIVALGDTDN